MKIAQISASYTPVSPHENKAIYSHVAWLVEGLVDKGHEVHLFASNKSETSATLHSVDFVNGNQIAVEQKRYEQWGLLSDCYKKANEGMFDIIHSHFNVMSAFFSDLTKTPTLISIHSPIEPWMVPILKNYKHLNYVSFSLSQRKQLPELNWVANIYHGVDLDLFTFNEKPENNALFLGRITSDKGTHHAIAASKESGFDLQIVGSSYQTEAYWHDEIAPHINGTSIRYLGEATLDEKIPILQRAKVLLFPIEWEEPFGYVMIEAMACGTPIIAFNRGSVSEIVKDGVTGFIVNTVEEMAEAMKKIDTIDRKEVRKRAEMFFSSNQMVDNYNIVYKRIIEKSKNT
jgi:glycosyltransferase involved in cell wall biosynthesis